MPRTFYIIDGHAHIYRSYFAPFRELTSPTGEPTKATFVFTQMLLNLIDQRKPDYLAMVIDGGEEEDEAVPVFRKALYPEYKANRAKRPDDFRPQEERIISWCGTPASRSSPRPGSRPTTCWPPWPSN
jgi:DNA polymerase-1